MENVLKRAILRPQTPEAPTQQAIREVTRRMEAMETQYAMLSDNDLIEACIFEMEALRAQYRFLLRRAKEENVSGSCRRLAWEG